MNRPRELDMVVLRRHPDGTPAVWCDPDIADIVQALNAGGVPTVASCSGHGVRPGNVALADGRELIVAADWHEARKVEAAFEAIEGCCFRCGTPITGPVCETCEAPLLSRAEPEPPSVGNIIGYRGPSRAEGEDDGSGACPGPAPPQTAHDDAPQPNCPECGHEADSRSRAIEAAFHGIPTQYVESESMRRKIAEGCIDDALNIGWMLTYEAWVAGRDKIAKHAYHEGRNEAEARVHQMEAQDNRHAFEPVDTPDVFDPDTCRRCGESRFHPSHLDPREGLDPDEQTPADVGDRSQESEAASYVRHNLDRALSGAMPEPEARQFSAMIDCVLAERSAGWRAADEERADRVAIASPRATPAEIDQQRQRGWPDFHPEDYCHRCGAPNPSWSVDSDRFNAAMGPPGSHRWQGIVCIGCFIQLHEAATGLTCTWRLIPETPFRPKDEDEQR